MTSSRDISSEKMATGVRSRMPTWAAMLRASDVLPMPGRAASTTRLDFWKPAVSSSSWRKPLPVPVRSPPSALSWVRRSNDSLSSVSMCSKSPVMRWSAIPNTICSARSTSSGGSPMRS